MDLDIKITPKLHATILSICAPQPNRDILEKALVIIFFPQPPTINPQTTPWKSDDSGQKPFLGNSCIVVNRCVVAIM